jgi:alpha-beta hydrolase superfamily lysophospholipase
MFVIPAAVSRRFALGLALLAVVVIGVPSLIRMATEAASVTDIHLRASSQVPLPALWPGLAVEDVSVERGSGLPAGIVRIGIDAPAGTPRADLLFFHGHSDRMDNHEALFTAWRDAGIRVISFDLPDHGGTAAGSLDTWSLDQLVVLASRVEEHTRTDRARPLFLAGFSVGGELAYHAAVHPDLMAQFGRRPVGLVLLSPALSVLPFTGGDGVSRSRDLVHSGGATLAPPSPAVPLANPLFAIGLLVQSRQDLALSLPHDIPVFVATGDDKRDVYVDVDKIRDWSMRLAKEDVRVDAIGCPGARHAIDNEAWPIGSDVLAASRAFLDGVLVAKPQHVALADCQPYEHAYLDGGSQQ